VQKDSLISKLKEFGIHNEEQYRRVAFSRNIGVLTEQEQDALRYAKIAIPGLGGVGGVHLMTLTRSGIGKFHIADFDTFDPVNINRQYGAKVRHFGRPKIEVMAEEALSVNPFLDIRQFPGGVTPQNIDDFLEDVDIVIDGVDFFEFETRRLLFNRSREKGIPVITAGPLGFSSAVLIFAPEQGMSFDEYFDIRDDMSVEEKLLSFMIGLAPKAVHTKYMDFSRVDLNARAGPSSNIACQLCSATAATEALRILLKRGGIKPAPFYLQFDPFLQKLCSGYLLWGNRHPVQRAKKFYVKNFLLRKRVAAPQAPEVPLIESPQNSNIPEEAIRFIIRAGVQAPSGDNAQPWKFSWKDNVIFVHLDAAADSSFFNVRQLASTISCGAVLENMRVAATAFGLDGKIVYCRNGEDSGTVGSLEMQFNARPTDVLYSGVWKRCTNRKLFDKKPIPETLLDTVLSQATSLPGVAVHALTSRSDIERIARVIFNVDRIRSEHRGLHEHLHQMIRYTPEEAITKRDGFPIENLEAGTAGSIFLRMTRPWWKMNLLNSAGFGKFVASHAHRSTLASSAVVLLTVSGMETEDFVRGGRALERMWLEATNKGLSVQPMTAVTLFWLRWQLEGKHTFDGKHQALLDDVWQKYRRIFPRVNFEKDGHVMLFRTGFGRDIKVRTLRKNIDDFILKH
jgi:molybdopterin/thiamine biosynthesis adenylyltransferase